ncbi:MAG: hypothetical protein ABI977_07835, partial [Acidobacteriota bacterium]
MLYLNPPYHIINGVSLFSDHADPLQYYYLPIAPHLTMRRDAQSGKRIPQLQLTRYKGTAGNGGFLSFDANLGIEPEELEEIRAELKRLARLSQPPRLAPVPLEDGSVKLMLLGAQTDQMPDAEAGTTAPRFVVKINHHATPSLYGDNQAAFSVQLDSAGVTLLEKALQGELAPIGIVYSLGFLALRPAYAVRLHLDWDRVQHHMDEHFGGSFLFFSAEIDKAVDELVENRAIVLEADTFVPEGEDASGIIARRDQALDEVREMITQAFFEPSLQPPKTDDGDWERAAWVAQRVSAIGASGGGGGLASFSYRKTDYTRIDRKILNANIQERTTVKRTICPQGHLTGLFRVFEQEQLDPARFIVEADLDDPWFKQRTIEVSTNADFNTDEISSIDVALRYGKDSTSFSLEPGKLKSTVSWSSLWVNRVLIQDVNYTYKITFKGVDGTERPISITSGDKVCSDGILKIDPRELYALAPIEIKTQPPFPWQRYPQVEVQTRYTDDDNGIKLSENFRLDEQHPKLTWPMFVRNKQHKRFSYRLVYHAANHPDITSDWADTDQGEVTARDPYAPKTLQIVPVFNWNEVDRVFVDVSHGEAAQPFEFTKDHNNTQAFSYGLQTPEMPGVAYKVTLIFKNNKVIEVPPSLTRQDRLIVNATMKGHNIVSVRPAAADFARKRVSELTVELRFTGEEGDTPVPPLPQTFNEKNAEREM